MFPVSILVSIWKKLFEDLNGDAPLIDMCKYGQIHSFTNYYDSWILQGSGF